MLKDALSYCRVDPSAQIASSVTLGFHAVVMADVRIGEGTTIGNNVVIYPGTEVGNRVTIFDNAVLGRRPQSAGNVARPFPNDLPPLRIGDDSVVGACAVLYTGTRIGRHVLVSDLCSIREGCVIGDYALLGRAVILNYDAQIGARTKIMDQTHITGKCRVGEDCFISVLVGTSNVNTMGPVTEEDIVGPTIEDGARIGIGVSILPGKRIGRNAMVSAGSVVSTNIPDGMLAGGSPARVIRDNPYAKR
jgi:UDP-3-O-[3-hydroxymyristoyl] glucosamine N-acyltransferase